MNRQQLSEALRNYGDVEENVSFQTMTTLKVGGNARYVVYPKDIFSLSAVLEICSNEKVPCKMLGFGSNILPSDDEFEGVIIRLNRTFNNLYVDNDEVIVQAGYSVISLAYEMMNRSLSGLEFASGIPGTVGGCVYMNAGAYLSSMSDVIEAVQVIKDGNIVWMENRECCFGYRCSVFQEHPDWIIIAVKLRLKPGQKEEIKDLMSQRQKRRFASQPLDKPSAGSVFRNPADHYAWEYVDMIGYRGRRQGGAMVSPKHSNFIVNEDNATAQDILTLIEEIQQKVRTEYNCEMIMEVEKFNWQN